MMRRGKSHVLMIILCLLNCLPLLLRAESVVADAMERTLSQPTVVHVFLHHVCPRNGILRTQKLRFLLLRIQNEVHQRFFLFGLGLVTK